MRKRPIWIEHTISRAIFLVAFSCAEIDGSSQSYSDEQKATSPPGPPVYAQLSAGVVRGYVSYAAGRDKPVNVFKVGLPELSKKLVWLFYIVHVNIREKIKYDSN